MKNSRRTGRSIAALLGGMLAVVILSIGTDMVLHATGVYPPWGDPVSGDLMLIALAYRTIYSVLGSYIAARFAPARPMQHALLLGVVGLVLSIAGAVATWNGGPAYGPRWYPLSLIATAMPCAWAGGKLREFASRDVENSRGAPTSP